MCRARHLAGRAVELLGVAPELIAPASNAWRRMIGSAPEMIPLNHKEEKTAGIVAESQAAYATPVIYLTPLYFGEKGVAERLRALVSAKTSSKAPNQGTLPVEKLSEEQQAAVKMALTHPVSILTGGPGHGEDHLPEGLDRGSRRTAQTLRTGFSHRTRRQTTLRSDGSSGQHDPSPVGIFPGGGI